jgi:hypothetical protein
LEKIKLETSRALETTQPVEKKLGDETPNYLMFCVGY